MSAGKNQRALLVEIMVAVLFFALCATVILQTFMAARESSRQVARQGSATAQLQALSEKLYAASSVEALLEQEGFRVLDGVWHKDTDEYALVATPGVEETEAGTIREVQLKAVWQEEVLAALSSVRYLPGEATE